VHSFVILVFIETLDFSLVSAYTTPILVKFRSRLHNKSIIPTDLY
jgi:hypothetical protein